MYLIITTLFVIIAGFVLKYLLRPKKAKQYN